ncbi:MAG TPA: hypothetical protein VK619_18530 [Pyrinomonadaceae bacterium]|nr:hypothetical protein [Pyrinomonadaceae bacterium]
MANAVCKVTVHKRGGADNLPYILREEAAKDPAAQTIEDPQRERAPDLTRQGQAHEHALEHTRQLELSFTIELLPLEEEGLTLDDDPIFTWNVPEFVIGDPYGIEWWEEESKREDKQGQEKGRFRGDEIGAGRQQRRELTLEEKRLNVETYFGLHADYEESRGGVSHYRIIITINQLISNRQFKRVILPFLSEAFSLNGAVVALHRNTGEKKTHAHVHTDSRQLDGRRIDLGQRYFKLDEIWARTCARYFKDPGIHDRHMEKKKETREWKERCRIAKERKEPLPPKPDREADHHGTKYARPFNDRWVGRQIAKESLAKKKLEYLVVTKAPKREIREARKEAIKQSDLLKQVLERRKEGKKGAKDYVPAAVVTVKEAEKIEQYERGIKTVHTREMSGHIAKVTDNYLKALSEKDLIMAAVSPEVGEAHAGRILDLTLGVLKEHNVSLERTEWSESTFKSEAREALQEFAKESITKSKGWPAETPETHITELLHNVRPTQPAAVSHKETELDARQIRVRMVLAGANELIEKHVLENMLKGERFGSLRKGDGRFENVIFDLKSLVFEHCVKKRSSLEELKLTEKGLTETLEKYVLGFGKGYMPPPFAGGARLKEVELEEKRLRARTPLKLAHARSYTRELSDIIAREGHSHLNPLASQDTKTSDLEAARLHGRAVLSGLRLDAAEREAERYKHYSILEEKIMVPDRYNNLMTWSLAQGKFFNATPGNSLRDRHWGSAPQVTEAVSDAERRVIEELNVRELAVRVTSCEFDHASSELAGAVKEYSSRGLKIPGPSFTEEQSLEAEELIYKTWNTDALEKLSRDEESHGLREAAERAGARFTLALLYQGEDRERQRVGDQMVIEKMRTLPKENPFKAELQAFLNYRQEERACIEKFVRAAGQISEHLQLRCEVELGERAPVLFRTKEAELVKEKLPSLEQQQRKDLTKDLNKNSFIQSTEGGIESAKFSDISPTDYGKHLECDLARGFEEALVLVL